MATEEFYTAEDLMDSVSLMPSTNGKPEPLTEGGPEKLWQPYSEVEVRPISFADEPLIQHSSFHLLAGRKGVGKSTILAHFVARITRGELGPKRAVVWVSSEDSVATDLRPRVEAAGGDPDLVVDVKKWITLPDDLPTLKQIVAEVGEEKGEVGMLIIDPVGNHVGGRDTNADGAVREAIGPLNMLADELELMIVGTRHLSEKEIQNILAGVLGASAWIHVPRVVLAAVRDDEDPELTHLQVVIGNRLPAGEGGRLYRLEGFLLDGHKHEVTRVVHVGDSSKDLDALVGKAREPSKSAQARELILDKLEAAPAMRLEADALDAEVAAEFGLKVGTVRNLKTQLKDKGLINIIPDKNGQGEILRWWIARTAAPRPEPSSRGVPAIPLETATSLHVTSSELDSLDVNWSPSSPVHDSVCRRDVDEAAEPNSAVKVGLNDESPPAGEQDGWGPDDDFEP